MIVGMRFEKFVLSYTLERVKGIEPSYSAWKSGNLVVFPAAVLLIEIITEFLVVRMAVASPMVAEHSARARGRVKSGKRNQRYRHSLMMAI